MRRGILFPLAGAMVASGAPLGLLFVRRYALGIRVPIGQEILGDPATYLYLTISTTLVLVALGGLLGRYVDRLAALSTTDPLTGLSNARAFYPRLEHEFARSRRVGSPVSLLLIDLDELKLLNDRHGHIAGDRALQQIGGAIGRELRAIDIGARVGGDEFAVLAVDATASDAAALAERLKNEVAATTARESGRPATVSIGVATFNPERSDAAGWQSLVEAADRALYHAKRAGRNRVVLAGPPPLYPAAGRASGC